MCGVAKRKKKKKKWECYLKHIISWTYNTLLYLKGVSLKTTFPLSAAWNIEYWISIQEIQVQKEKVLIYWNYLGL